MYSFGKKSLENLEGVWSPLILVGERALEMGIIDFGVPNKAIRTQEEQDALYAQGRTVPGKIVTKTRNSKHIPIKGVGYAVDYVPFVDGKYTWEERPCLIMATCILKAIGDFGYKIDWGYHLWGWDMPHFQRRF